MIKRISKGIAAVIAVAVLVGAVMAYYFRTADTTTGAVYDGFGRLLSEPPLWAQLIVTAEPVWAGLGWHLFDIVWFFGGLYIAFRIYDWGSES